MNSATTKRFELIIWINSLSTELYLDSQVGRELVRGLAAASK
jgi:hypothetical protein